MVDDVQAARDVVNEASLPAAVRDGVLGRLDKLPPLYRGLAQTYESRFHDAIVLHARGMLRSLATVDGESDGESLRVAGRLLEALAELHGRLGIAPLPLKPPVPAPVRRKPKAR